MKNDNVVLLLDGDAAHRRLLALALLEQGGIGVVEAGTIAEASRLMDASPAHVQAVVLEVGLPDGDGRTLCRDLRQRFPTLPILFLTERDEAPERGFESGASDYLRKPARSLELLARLRAHRRSVEMSIDASMQVGPFMFRPGQRSLFEASRNQRIWLTAKEVGILRCLLSASGAPVPRDTLLRTVWGLTDGAATHTLETHIYRLRQKLSDESLLVTGRGGYKLAA